jgi:hypothetical protein
MGFFDSDIVQKEAAQFMQDYQSLTALGGNYGQFDRAGKEMYIEQMEDLLSRYRVFLKRMELSDDFMAQMSMKQMHEQIGTLGVSPAQMFEQMERSLARMKQEIK